MPRNPSVPGPYDTYLAQDVFLAQRETHEVQDKDLTVEERQGLVKGKMIEWNKLLNTQSKIHTGEEADKLRSITPKDRILESRFVKTRRENPNIPGETEIKCRWCVKGFRDPDLYELDRQSPTLSLESFMVCLQLIASHAWQLHICDVEGAFLQGEPIDRSKGRIFVKLPKDGVPNQKSQDLVELLKCVYGLADAPRHWWLSFSKSLVQLGMKQSQLDPCTFFLVCPKSFARGCCSSCG